MKLTPELLPTQRLSIAAEEFSEPRHREQLNELLSSKDNLKFISSLVFSTSMFVFRDLVEDLSPYTVSANGPKIPVIADVSLSGGYAGMQTEVVGIVGRYGFENTTFTMSRMPTDGIRFAKKRIVTPKDKLKVNLLMTGALPENDPIEFKNFYRVGLSEFTRTTVKDAEDIGVFGVYASAGLVPIDADVVSLGSGISFDGQPYSSYGVNKRSITVDEGLKRCSQLLIGKILFTEGRSIQENFYEICEKIDSNI